MMLLDQSRHAGFGTEVARTPPATTVGLSPARWGPILSAASSSEAHLRSGNAVHALIDGAETFRSMVGDLRATQGRHDFIYLLGWDIVDNFNLVPGLAPLPTSAAELFREADSRNVQIRVMLWAKPVRANQGTVDAVNRLAHGAAILDDLTANNRPISNAQIVQMLINQGVNAAAAALMASTIRRSPASLLGSHHQKVMIIKRGELLVAYCGGVDINRNRLVAVEPNDPQHDAHCRIIGPSAWDLLQTFIKRWRHHPEGARHDAGPKGPLLGVSEPVPGAIPTPAVVDAPFGGSSSVIIGRTFNPIRAVPGTPAVIRERDIKNLVIAAIDHADRFIYLEDQYLIDLEVAAALNHALPRLQHVTILIPGNSITSGGHPFVEEYRRDFIERVRTGLSPATAGKCQAFQLSNSQSAPAFGRHSYVHAKTWVIDDELAIIGSANCNRRGYQHDSEVDAFVFGSNGGWNGSSSFAQAYRMRLWNEHLGAPLSSLVDGVASSLFWRRATRSATARVFEFDHRLPTGIGQSIRDLAADALLPLIDPVP
jgi:phosphatidylserine/phosphatidylglycerophosphate/cardiolipin synthase-like enzyme